MGAEHLVSASTQRLSAWRITPSSMVARAVFVSMNPMIVKPAGPFAVLGVHAEFRMPPLVREYAALIDVAKSLNPPESDPTEGKLMFPPK